jgi:hypothetical protein
MVEYPSLIGGSRVRSQSGVGRMAGIEGVLEFIQTRHINFDSRDASAGAGKSGGNQ